MEEYKENINTFSMQIEDKKGIIQQLEHAKRTNESLTQDEQKTLEKRLFNLKQKLENEREKLKSIDQMLTTKARAIDDNQIKLSAFEEASAFDRNCNLMSKSFNENMFFNRNKIEASHFDFNLNHDSEEDSGKVLNNDVAIVPIATSSTRNLIANNIKTNNAASSNNASPLMMPKYHSSSSINGLVPYSKSQKSNGDASATSVVQRQIPKHKRPLTRYLPNFSLEFNLRHHIETAGHQIQLCPHVIIDGNFSWCVFLNYRYWCCAWQ